MAFIQAPSYKPPQLYDTWGGLADIFSNFAEMRESKRQIERQRIADAQSAAAHASVQRNRDQLHAQRAALEAERLAAIDAQLTESEFVDAMRTYGGVKNIPEMKGSYGSDPSQVSGWDEIIRNRVPDTGIIPNVNRRATAEERHEAQFNLSGRLPRDQVLNLGTLQSYTASVQSQLLQLEQAQRQAEAAGDTRAVRELQIKKLEVEARLAEATEKDKIAQAEETAKWQKIRAENAFRTQQEAIRRGENLKTVSGQNFRPVDRASVPRGGNVARIPGVSDQSQQTLWGNQFNQALNELSSESPSTYTPERRAELTANIGLADVASSKIGWPELDEKIKTSGYSRVQLNKELASFMKDIAGSSDDFTADEQVVSSEAILEALLQLQNINPQKDWLSEYRQIKADKTNFIRETGSRSWGTLGLKDVNWDPLTSEEITLTMLLKESKKRQDPQYENDKKRFKDKFGWLPKWA